jgi:hypothetical protein
VLKDYLYINKYWDFVVKHKEKYAQLFGRGDIEEFMSDIQASREALKKRNNSIKAKVR